MRLCKKIALTVASLVLGAGAHAVRPCDEFFARLPNVSWALCESAQLQASTGKSVKGLTIYTCDVEPGNARLRVLMDVQMPVMDGYDATRAIREQLGMASLPIIAMTANARPAGRNICLEAGMIKTLEKPFGLSQVFSALVRHTGFAPQGKRHSDDASTRT
jgi:CheY-like chemotaxis protein